MTVDELLRKYHKEHIEADFDIFEEYEDLVVSEGLGSDKVFKYIVEKTKTSPTNPFNFYHLFEYYIWNKDFEKALEILDELKEQFPFIEGMEELKEIVNYNKPVLLKKKLEKRHTNMFSILVEN